MGGATRSKYSAREIQAREAQLAIVVSWRDVFVARAPERGYEYGKVQSRCDGRR
jgi:hypothetical protein